ncbi:MAG: restriction endonuclease subunit S [Chloroflexota bacterium]
MKNNDRNIAYATEKNDSITNGWKEYRLGDLGNIITGKTPSSKFPDEFGDLLPFVTPSDFKNYYKWISDSIRFLSNKGVNKLRNKVLPKDSILVTCIGSDLGKVAINRLPVITNQQINSIITNKEVHFEFLYYKLKEAYDYLSNLGNAGTAVPIINKSTFEEIQLYLPSLPEQKAIAEVLSSLDDKIDLLHRQNKTLEELAETLFRQRFIDEAEEETIVLGDVVKTTSGGTPSRKHPEYYNGDIKWVKSKELKGSFIFNTEEKITNIGLIKSSAKILKKNTILIAMYGATVGEYGILDDQATCNQAICALIPNRHYPYTYLYMYIRMNKESIISKAVGSAQQNISQVLIKELEVSRSLEKIKKYHEDVELLFDKMRINNLQILNLQQTRDTLLPKLMSGEARVEMIL